MRLTLALAALLAFGPSAFAADSQLMNLVMPDAKVLAGVNVTSALTSPLGQFALQQLHVGAAMPAFLRPDNITEVLAASAANPGSPAGLLLMKGTFDPSAIIAALAAAPKQPSYNVSTYAGATLITFPKNAVAFIGSSIAVAGDPASVTAALDRSANTNTLDAVLMAQVGNLSATEDAWVVSTASPGALLPANAPAQAAQASQFLANVQSFSGGVKFGQDVPVTLDVVANSPQNAEALGNVVKLLITMAGSASNSGPLPSLLQNLQVNTSGSTLDLAVTIPEAQIEALISAGKTPQPQSRDAQ
jgi:hypothetical protein